VEARGIEADFGQPEITVQHQSGTISTDADPANVSDRTPKSAIVRDVVTESSEANELKRGRDRAGEGASARRGEGALGHRGQDRRRARSPTT